MGVGAIFRLLLGVLWLLQLVLAYQQAQRFMRQGAGPAPPGAGVDRRLPPPGAGTRTWRWRWDRTTASPPPRPCAG